MKHIFFAISLTLTPFVSQSATLNVKVVGVQSDNGYIMIALYDREEAYMNLDLSAAAKKIKAKKGTVNVTFPDIKSGSYAVTLYHDENGNEKLDDNFFGIPKEGYGFGNNARGLASEPDFSAAAVDVKDKEKTISVFLSY